MTLEGPLRVSTPALETIGPEWDEFVAATPGGDLVQTSGWAATKQDLGVSAHALVLRHGGKIGGGAIIHLRSVAPTIRLATITKGPLVGVGHAAITDQLCAEAMRAARRLRAVTLVIQAPADGGLIDQGFARAGFVGGIPPIAPVATSRLDLGKTDDELLAAMSAMRRRNIRASIRNEVSMAFTNDVQTFHALHTASAVRQGFEPLALATLESQWRHLGASGRVAILTASHEGRPVAGLWLTSFAGTVTYKLPGWDSALPQPKHVNEALHWHAIRWARSIGAHTYDFGGFDRQAAERAVAGETMPDGFDRTPNHFKAGFGGEVVLMPMARFRVLAPVAGRPMSVLGARALGSTRGRAWIERFRNR